MIEKNTFQFLLCSLLANTLLVAICLTLFTKQLFESNAFHDTFPPQGQLNDAIRFALNVHGQFFQDLKIEISTIFFIKIK